MVSIETKEHLIEVSFQKTSLNISHALTQNQINQSITCVLVSLQNNADENISCYEMSCDQYQMFINLVQYYQMETRWSIKKLLLKTFTAACHLDHIIVDILLTSVLPLEIVS